MSRQRKLAVSAIVLFAILLALFLLIGPHIAPVTTEESSPAPPPAVESEGAIPMAGPREADPAPASTREPVPTPEAPATPALAPPEAVPEAVEPPTEPSAISESAATGDLPKVRFERIVPEGGYTPGAPLDVQLGMDYPAEGFPVTALAVVESLPRGWTFAEVTSEIKPDIMPAEGAQDTLEFIWISVPEFPMQLTYTANVPLSEGGGTREIRGRTLYRTDGGQRKTPDAITELPEQ
jgi:hypothetical protein